jgi:predicted RNA-binding protein with PIN domain
VSAGRTAWLIDGNNVMGSRPDGWWRDRRGAARALAAQLADFAAREGVPVTVVFDGAPFEIEVPGEAPLEVAFAVRRGRDAADDEIARRVAGAADPAALTVVTSDAGLARRAREHGAEVVGAGRFRRGLDLSSEGPSQP